MWIFLAGLVLFTISAIMIGRGQFPLPDISGRAVEMSLPRDPSTRPAKRVHADMAGHKHESDVIRLAGGHDALGSRLALADLDTFLAGEAAKKLVGQLETGASRFTSGAAKPEFTRVEVVADDPVKGEGKARREQLMIAQLS